MGPGTSFIVPRYLTTHDFGRACPEQTPFIGKRDKLEIWISNLVGHRLRREPRRHEKGRRLNQVVQGSGQLLIVDDEEPVRVMLKWLLEQSGYTCHTAADAQAAIDLLEQRDFDLVLTDLQMPGMSGLDLIAQVIREYPGTATVMATGVDDTHLARRTIELGAYGYLTKPFQGNEVVISIANALRRRDLEMESLDNRARLEEMVKERTEELWQTVRVLEIAERNLQLSNEETIRRLALAAEYRDDATGRHVLRMSRYCALLARAAGHDEQTSERIRTASQMHDVGKIGIPDSVLLKRGRLTPDERASIERHPEIGYQILAGSDSELLNLAATIARTHHERVDGAGYPRRLVGNSIPIEGRIAAIADVFDALTTNRVYRREFPLMKALSIMKEGRRRHFDGDLLDLFFDNIDAVLDTKHELDDS